MSTRPLLRPVPPSDTEHRSGCSLMCQATLRGTQAIDVRALTPVCGTIQQTLIAVRVGGIVLLVADRKALASLQLALSHAEVLAGRAFGARP